MTEVIYNGPSDAYELDKADFKKADVEDQNKIRFDRGIPTEVSDAAAQALTEKGNAIFGEHDFSLVESEEEAEEARAAAADDEDPADNEPEPEVPEGGERQQGLDTPTASAGTGTAGAGTSTGARSTGGRTGRSTR